MNFFKSIFSRRPSSGDSNSGRRPAASVRTSDSQEYEPPAANGGKLTNLVYQDHGDAKGGSDSASKLAAIKLPSLQGRRFLDLGCNAGFFCAHAMEQGASYALGVDSSDKVIAIARERYPSIDFRGGGWDHFPEGEFDVVICLSAIHYAKDAVALAKNIRACLSSNGVFVLEGGLIGATEDLWTDTLIPVWREVGDKCRHLSRGFVERHLLTGYSWDIVGESVNQGGDPVKRYAIHARPGADAVSDARATHRVCPLEFAAALAQSAETIHAQQPSYQYVRALGAVGVIDGEKLSAVLANSEDHDLFVQDLVFALNNHRSHIEMKASAGPAFTAKLVSSLEANGVKVTLLQ